MTTRKVTGRTVERVSGLQSRTLITSRITFCYRQNFMTRTFLFFDFEGLSGEQVSAATPQETFSFTSLPRNSLSSLRLLKLYDHKLRHHGRCQDTCTHSFWIKCTLLDKTSWSSHFNRMFVSFFSWFNKIDLDWLYVFSTTMAVKDISENMFQLFRTRL